jgi:hypothetical protein
LRQYLKQVWAIGFICAIGFRAIAQEPVTAAARFIESLSSSQRSEALFPFDSDERYNFHFIPRNRKGIAIGALDRKQKEAAVNLMRSCLSGQTVQKITDIMSLEYLLRKIEGRSEDDHYRDADRYYFTVFGVPGDKTIWGWRVEGHHVSFNFSVNQQKLVAGTPGFLGANPAVVKDGPEKAKEVLKEETETGFALLTSLDQAALQKAVFSRSAPADIITSANRKAMIDNNTGISYAEMNAAQKEKLLQLVHLYVHRFTRLFAEDMLKEIQKAGLDNLRFAWAGDTGRASGKAYYYRVQGPTIIIEYDNSQNSANHIHTVVRDLQHDFGGDMLLGHYRSSH